MFDTHFLFMVGGAGILGYLSGMVWFSPQLFMRPWTRALGKTEADVAAGKKELPRTMIYGFLNTLATAFALAVLIELTGVATLTQYFQIVFFALFAFIATTKFNDLIYASSEPAWSRNPQTLFLINLGYYILSFSVMTLVLWFAK